MGELFRAHDGRLNRDVAIKVLPPEAIANPERRQRFGREAEVLASLSHTNIAHVYGLEGVGESTAIVMEFVDGPTLDERIARGPLPIDEALSTAAQACEGLEAAHERGIVHRDLKPANIKLRTDGVVKILDFGLARALTGDGNADVANSPTMLTAATEAGVVLGTAADMSPEQARGQSVDRRADIWAFGCVLYEMLTSAQAFGGRGRPTFWWASFSRSRSGRDCRPPCRRESGNCCTAVCGKTRRIACDIADARYEIERALGGADSATSSSSTAAPVVTPSSRRYGAMLACFAAGAVATLAAVQIAGRIAPPEPERVPTRAIVTLPPNTTLALGRGSSVAVSPDGRRLVFSAPANDTVQLYVRGLDRFASLAIPGTEGASNPSFLPMAAGSASLQIRS